MLRCGTSLSFRPVDGLIFTTKHGLPWRREGYSQRISNRAVREAGLPAGTTSHDLRHHFASLLLFAGESVVAVAERLGDTPQLVLSIYGNLMPDSEAEHAAQSTRRGPVTDQGRTGVIADRHRS